MDDIPKETLKIIH